MNCSSWYMRARPMRWSDESGKQESTAAVTCWLAARALRSRRTGSGEDFSMRRTYCNGRSPHIKCEKEAIILEKRRRKRLFHATDQRLASLCGIGPLTCKAIFHT